MRAVVLGILWLWGLMAPAWGSDLTALARVVPEETRVEQSLGRVTLTIGLSQGVPYRVYTLADPNQLVLEFSEVNWAGFDAAALETRSAGPAEVGKLAPGWSGFVMDLDAPFQLEESALETGEALALLTVTLKRSSQEAFAAASGVPPTSVALRRSAPATEPNDEAFVVVIDPGHGGVDPGAERGGVVEAELMLMMARELRDGLRRVGGFDVHLTRDSDVFVSLPARASMARRLEADAFISLHADALESGYAEGATAYTLAKEATDAASALLAERHNRADMLGGVDLGGQEDEIAAILLDLARLETTPRSAALATSVLDGLTRVGARLNSNPQRAADFAVLRSADVPSVLVEVGFLSSERDRIELQSPEKRGRIIDGLVQGVAAWAEGDQAERARMRQ
ncbi:MAG: N-acetylmuramoyl-L-alanine amidase [Pseudomonadota bacterium]